MVILNQIELIKNSSQIMSQNNEEVILAIKKLIFFKTNFCRYPTLLSIHRLDFYIFYTLSDVKSSETRSEFVTYYLFLGNGRTMVFKL